MFVRSPIRHGLTIMQRVVHNLTPPEMLLGADCDVVGADDDGRAVLVAGAAGGGVGRRGDHPELASEVGDQGPPAGLEGRKRSVFLVHSAFLASSAPRVYQQH